MISSIFAKIALLLTFITFFSAPMDTESGPLLILNMENQQTLPKTFRMSTNPLKEKTEVVPSTEGLVELNASASGQFSEKCLQKILSLIPSNKVLIIDLREESHGFVDGNAVSWYGKYDWANFGKTFDEIMLDESQRLDEIAKNGYLVIYNELYPLTIYASDVCDEATIAKRNGADYIRIPITDHVKPADAMVDRFVELVETKDPQTWIHFHCAAGKGRATTFFALYDMMHNAKTVSFHDITLRQALIGGKDLLTPPDPNVWKYHHSLDRIQFLKDFYRFAKEREKGQTWSSWQAKQGH